MHTESGVQRASVENWWVFSTSLRARMFVLKAAFISNSRWGCKRLGHTLHRSNYRTNGNISGLYIFAFGCHSCFIVVCSTGRWIHMRIEIILFNNLEKKELSIIYDVLAVKTWFRMRMIGFFKFNNTHIQILKFISCYVYWYFVGSKHIPTISWFFK